MTTRASIWLAAVERTLAGFPECVDADGCFVRDGAGRVVATFADEWAAGSLLGMLGDLDDLAEQWAEDETELGKLQASDEGHQAETEAAEAKHGEEKRRADRLDLDLDDARTEIASLRAQLALATRERL